MKKEIKAVDIKKSKFGFIVFYENGKKLEFDLEYFNREEIVFN